MSGEVYQPPNALYVEEEQLLRMEHALGPDGPGVMRLTNVLNPSFHQALLAEIANPDCVQWRDAGDTYPNDRGVLIEQNHDTFALKLSVGDPTPIANVPLMQQLAHESEGFVQSLSSRYPSLADWRADEMSYHRYYKETGLTPHRDNMRFPGLIVVIAIDGESDFQVLDRVPTDKTFSSQFAREMVTEWEWRSTYTIPTKPGDMVLTRAPGLFPDMKPNDRPEHAVMNCQVLPRISFMLRANLKPEDTSYGFEYHNWP